MKDMNMRSINCNASGLLSRLALVVALLTGVLSAQGQGNNSEPAVGDDVTALCSVTPAYSTDGKFTFTMPDYSVYAEIEYIESYSLSGEKVFFYPENSINPITAAAEGETVTVSFDYGASIGNKYFTGRYTSDDVTITTNEVGDGTFTMPANAVTVTPVLAQQEEYVINLTTATTQTIPESMWILLNTLDKYLVPNEKGDLILDLNEDLKYDIQLIEDYNEAAGVSTYSVLRLEGADDITSPIQLSLSYVHNLQYNSVLFVLNTPKPIQSDWITVGDGTPLVYNGQAQTPAVVVKYGTTVLSAETDYEVTYDNNKNAGTAKVTVTAKATSMSYTGTATATFTIAPKVVTSPTITLSATTAAYTGSDLTPTVTAVKDGETTIADTEYTVSYKKGSEAVNKCIEPGEHTVVISDGEGGNYTVSGTATFTITKEAIDAVINLIDAIGTVEYTDASKAKIGAARTAYDALSEAQQALVTNSATLTDAEASYQTLKEAAEKAAAEQAAAELAAKQKAFEEGITAEDYSGTYDGQTHIITMKIPEGATVKYGTEIDKYGTDKPSFKDAGTYIVYYEVSMEGLTSVTGSANVEITRKALELVADPKTIIEGEALPDFTGSITGFVTGESLGDADVLTFSVEGPPSTEGEYAVTGKLNNEASGNYGKNYTFDNAAANETAFTINPIPTCTLGGLIYKITSTSQHTAELKEYEDDGPTGELVIPATIEYEGTDYTVTSIGDGALVFCYDLTSVTIPASVKRIGDTAFGTCTGLTSVTIPDGVTSIGKSAFETTNLASVTIPASVTSVGESAFHNCQKLESVTVYTPSVPTSDGQIFTGRKSKVKVNVYVLSELVKAFTNDENWSTNAGIKAMVSITTQPTSSLELTAGDESGNVLKVEATAADGYTLTYQWFANTSVSNEGGTAISGATMASYTVPTTTANTYYYYCVVTATRTDKKFTVTSDVATVTVKEKVVEKKTIENSWITVVIATPLVYNGQAQTPAVVVKYGETQLSSKTDYKVTYKNNKDAGTATVFVIAKATSTNYTGRAKAIFTIARKALELVADQKTITEGDALPDFTGSITGFVEGEGLKKTDVLKFSVEGPPSTEGEYAVTGTLNGKASGNYGKNYTFRNAAANETAFTINPIPTCTYKGLTYKITSMSQHTAELKGYEGDKPTGELDIPAKIRYEGKNYTVNSIGDGALSSCYDLTSITIPASVKRIGDTAFGTCTGLTSVTIPDRVTSIGESAFETTNLASVTIPASVKSVGKGAFHNCQSLKSVTVYTASVPTSDGQIFTGRTSKVKVYVLSNLVNDFTNDKNWSTNADIKDLVTIIIDDLEKSVEGKRITVNIDQTNYAPITVTKEYFLVMGGVTVNAIVSASRVSLSGNEATYQVKKNVAKKLTFWGVEWKEDGALLTCPSYISFSGADIDTSNLFFTNIKSLTAKSSMTLVKDFGNTVGVITGTTYKIGTNLKGKGKASLSGKDLIFTAETEAVKTEREQTHNTLMGMGTNCEITFTACQVNATLEGLGLTSNTGNDGTASLGATGATGGGRERYHTGSRRFMTRGGNARRPFFSISYSGARIMCKAEDVEARPVENRSKTRGTEDYLTIESGKTYDILTDEDLILTLKLSEGDILITSITLQVPEEPEEPELPGDANGDGVVNAADIVKAISDGKSQAEIDEIVKAIMGN